MSEKSRKTRYWAFKGSSILVSCLCPLLAIYEHFPMWIAKGGTPMAVGSGTIIGLIVIAMVFHDSVFEFAKKRLKLENSPPLLVWFILIIVTYILQYINAFLTDLAVVLWMGLIGCALGTVFTYIAESRYGKKEEKDG